MMYIRAFMKKCEGNDSVATSYAETLAETPEGCLGTGFPQDGTFHGYPSPDNFFLMVHVFYADIKAFLFLPLFWQTPPYGWSVTLQHHNTHHLVTWKGV